MFNDNGSFLLALFEFFLFFAWFMCLFWVLRRHLPQQGPGRRGQDAVGPLRALHLWLGLLVYVLVRGKGMQERQLEQAREMQAAQAAYIQSVAGSPPTPTARSRRPRRCFDRVPSPRPSSTRSRPRHWHEVAAHHRRRRRARGRQHGAGRLQFDEHSVGRHHRRARRPRHGTGIPRGWPGVHRGQGHHRRPGRNHRPDGSGRGVTPEGTGRRDRERHCRGGDGDRRGDRGPVGPRRGEGVRRGREVGSGRRQGAGDPRRGRAPCGSQCVTRDP